MELEFLDWLRAKLPPTGAALGLRDDAALLSIPPDRELVVTTDAIVEGTHFLAGEHTPELIGRKALAVNLSDLAAMAATPLAAFISIVVPRNGAAGVNADVLLRRVYEGLLPLAAEFNVEIAGGDTNVADAPLTIAVTLLGTVPRGRAWLRSGALPGDAIVVTGPLGGSIAGHHLTFTPRVREALAIAKSCQVRAAMDISDGLSLDLARMCAASGVGAEIDAAAIPITSAAIEAAQLDGRSPLEHAINDGEDFELLLAVPPTGFAQIGAALPAATVIGHFSAPRELWISHQDAREPLAPRGFEHGVK